MNHQIEINQEKLLRLPKNICVPWKKIRDTQCLSELNTIWCVLSFFSMWKYAAVSVGSAQEWEHSKIGRNEGTRNKLILTFSSL